MGQFHISALFELCMDVMTTALWIQQMLWESKSWLNVSAMSFISLHKSFIVITSAWRRLVLLFNCTPDNPVWSDNNYDVSFNEY